MTANTPTILCPLRMEAAKVRPVARRRGWTLVTTGIGATAVTSAVEAAADTGPLVLAGVAGALQPDLKPGTAHLVHEVYDEAGIIASPLLTSGLRVTGADEIVATPDDKAALSGRTGAHLVDMESHAFAAAANRLGRPWVIVRGVSDGVEHHLPPGCDRWFTPDGRLLLRLAARDLAGRPRDLLHLIAFGRRTAAAMRAVARLLDCTLAAGADDRLKTSGYAAP
ncbi:MAG: hypothetical protein QF733_01725 [Phycisphaerales bacterium]|jgi:hypothetical protein|nr:hypothetical protein [Phycisphaerales bacterium]